MRSKKIMPGTRNGTRCESYIAPGTSIDESAITSMSMYVHVQLSVVMLKLKVKMIQMGGAMFGRDKARNSAQDW
jgi:hypothetical protein